MEDRSKEKPTSDNLEYRSKEKSSLDNMVDRSKDPDNVEYSTQFFNFTPRSFVDSIYNVLSEHVQDGLIKFYSRLRKSHPDGHLLNLTKPEIVEKIKSVCDKNFDKLELFLRSNITQIPKITLLPEDYVHRTNKVSTDEIIKIKMDIEKLEKKLLEAYHVERSLKEEMGEIVETITALTKVSLELKQTLNKFQEGRESNILKEFSILTSKDRQILNEIPRNISNEEDNEACESENE